MRNVIENYYELFGVPLAVIYALVLLIWQVRKRNHFIDGWFIQIAEKFHLNASPRARKIIVISLCVLAVGAWVYCVFCGKSISEKAAHDASFFHILVSFTIRVFPYFVAGCVISGFIEKVFSNNHRWLPRGMIGAGALASLLPICSCAAVPFSYSLMATGKIRLRAVVTFMMVVPVLNPFVIVFAQGMIGWEYVLLRIVSIFVLAMVTGSLVEYFLGEREPGNLKKGCFSCKGCGNGGATMNTAATSLEAGYNLMAYLTPYIIIGVIIGASFSVFITPPMVGKYLSSNVTGLFLAVLIGVPVFLCSGEDVLILAPLLGKGLPMGHAIALTLAGNGICLSSIAMLIPLFGRKATIWITLAFFFGSIVIGLVINLLM